MVRRRALEAQASGLAGVGRVGEAAGALQCHLDIAPVDIEEGAVELKATIEPVAASAKLIIDERVGGELLGDREVRVRGDIRAAIAKSLGDEAIEEEVAVRLPGEGDLRGESG